MRKCSRRFFPSLVVNVSNNLIIVRILNKDKERVYSKQNKHQTFLPHPPFLPPFFVEILGTLEWTNLYREAESIQRDMHLNRKVTIINCTTISLLKNKTNPWSLASLAFLFRPFYFPMGLSLNVDAQSANLDQIGDVIFPIRGNFIPFGPIALGDSHIFPHLVHTSRYCVYISSSARNINRITM